LINLHVLTRRKTRFIEVKLTDGCDIINLGSLDDQERDELANLFLEASYDLGPKFKRDEWFRDQISKMTIFELREEK
jgi:hypothetical protein